MIVENFLKKGEQIIPQARYISLQQQYNANKKQIHVFVEDDDDFEFYRFAISHVYHSFEAIPYPLKGKKNLKECYQLIKWEKFDKGRLLFFADKDYDDILQIEKITERNFFYTKYYSIENYLVTNEVFSIILKRFCTNEFNETIRKRLLNLFDDAYSRFCIKMRAITWFILVDREKSKKADLDKLKLGELFYFENMSCNERKIVTEKRFDLIMKDQTQRLNHGKRIRKRFIKDLLVEKCGADHKMLSFENINNKRKLISTLEDHKVFIRGKYDLWFLEEILQNLDSTIKHLYAEEGIRVDNSTPIPKQKLKINSINIFDLICSKISHPEDILDFLYLNFQQLHGNNNDNIQ